jgi:hypothetical protein
MRALLDSCSRRRAASPGAAQQASGLYRWCSERRNKGTKTIDGLVGQLTNACDCAQLAISPRRSSTGTGRVTAHSSLLIEEYSGEMLSQQ